MDFSSFFPSNEQGTRDYQQMIPYHNGSYFATPQKAHQCHKAHHSSHNEQKHVAPQQDTASLLTQLISVIQGQSSPPPTPQAPTKMMRPYPMQYATESDEWGGRGIPLAQAFEAPSPMHHQSEQMMPYSAYGSSGKNAREHKATVKHNGKTETKSMRAFIDQRNHKRTIVKTIRTVYDNHSSSQHQGSRKRACQGSCQADNDESSSGSESESDY